MRALRFAPLFLSAAASMSAGAAFAQDGADCAAPSERGAASPAVAFIWENDATVGPDRDYTNGLGLIYSVPEGSCAPLDGVAESLGRVFDRSLFHSLPFLGPVQGESVNQLAVGIGHQLYTPDDLTRADPDPLDRPYAAWAYYSIAHIRETRAGSVFEDGLGALTAVSITELNIGAVGPMVQGEWLQRSFHDLIDAEVDPQGWGHQLRNEPGVVVRHERMVSSRWDQGPIDLELSLNAGASLGNIITDASAGIGFRLGYNIGVDYGPARLRPGLSAPNRFAPGGAPFSVYAFGGVGGRAVARNIFLDGNTFADSRSVDKHVLVGDYQLGAAVVMGRVKLAATRIWRTEEFSGQGRHSAFDSFTLSWRY